LEEETPGGGGGRERKKKRKMAAGAAGSYPNPVKGSVNQVREGGKMKDRQGIDRALDKGGTNRGGKVKTLVYT